MRKFWLIILVLTAVAIYWGCSDKIEQPGDLPEPGTYNPDTTYVMVTPVWTGADGLEFNHPNDVIVGYDKSIYIADTYNDRIVRLDLAGNFIESIDIHRPTQIAQDRALDLLAVTDSSVVLRRDYSEDGDFVIVHSEPDVLLPPPPDDHIVPAALYGICASPFPDKSYYFSHYYENGILKYNSSDNFVRVQVYPGIGVGYAMAPLALNAKEIKSDFYLCYTSGSASFSIQVLNLTTGEPVIPDTAEVTDIYSPTVTGYKDITMDEFGNIFVTMATRSEIWKYDRYGKFDYRFGQEGSGADLLKNPRGIDSYQNYLYVADRDNNRIVRFEASTSAQQ